MSKDNPEKQPGDEEYMYFAKAFGNIPHDTAQSELYFSFVSLMAMTWARMFVQNTENPPKMVEYFINHWKKYSWEKYNAGLSYHANMLQTELGKLLVNKVGDTEEHRVKMHRDISVVEKQIRAILTPPKEDEGFQ